MGWRLKIELVKNKQTKKIWLSNDVNVYSIKEYSGKYTNVFCEWSAGDEALCEFV